MKYKVNFTSREWEIIGEGFNFDDYYAGKYDDTERLYFSREAWQGDIPIFLLYWNLKNSNTRIMKIFIIEKNMDKIHQGFPIADGRCTDLKMERLWGFQGFSPDVSCRWSIQGV